MVFIKGFAVSQGAGRPKGSRGTHEKTIIKIKIAARMMMTNLGYTDQQIASHIGMKLGTFKMLKKTTAFQSATVALASGITSAMDQDINNQYNLNRKAIESAVPTAIENLLNLASQKLDKKLMFEASKEILDRHGEFAKVSRHAGPTKEQSGIASEEDNKVAQEIAGIAASQKKEAEKKDANIPIITIDAEPLTNSTN